MNEDAPPEQPAYADASPFQPKQQAPLLERAVPVSQELPAYGGGHAQRDVLAGVTVAALALPSAMAYAELAGLSPVNGLYALLLPTVVYVLLGSSRQLVIGPEGSISALVAAAILPLAAAGSAEAVELAAALALLVAACFLAARALRLGWLADYFSRPVLIGYLHGVAVVLVVSQLGKLLGLDIDARDPLPQIGEVVRELDETSGITLAVGAAALGDPDFPALRRRPLPRGAARRRRRDRRLLVARPRGARRRGDRERPERASRTSTSRSRAAATPCCSCLPRSGSSSSASPTRSSPRGRSPASTASTCGRSRRCSRWERPTWPPA